MRLKRLSEIRELGMTLNKKRETIISYILVAVGALIYISLTFNNNVWLDEAFSASLVRTDMAGVMERTMADTLPPLYNVLLKIVTDIFGYKVQVMKIMSAVPMIAIMLLSATFVRKSHGFKSSVIFTIALFTMPNLLFYGVEIRMYSLGFMFATASGILAYEFITDYSIKNLLIFTIVSVLAGYSHHFALVTVGFVYLFLLLYYFILERENIKRWFICVLLTVVLYFPCLLLTLKQFKSVSGYFSMPDVTLSVFIKYMRYPYTSGNTVVSIVILISVAALFAYTCFKTYTYIKCKKMTKQNANNKSAGADKEKAVDLADGCDVANVQKTEMVRDIYALSMFLAYYGVLLFGTVVTKLMTANIFVDRYLFFAHGLIWLFFAIEAGRFKKYYTAVVAIMLVAGIIGYISEYKIEYTTNPDKLITFLEENVKEGDVLYTIEDAEEMAFCLPFYDERLTNYEELDDAISAAENSNSNIWISVIDYSECDFSELEDNGFKAEKEDTFSFDRYTFDMYKAVPAY